MMQRSSRTRTAMTLIEVTIVMALFVVLSSIMATSLVSIIRIERADAAAFHKTTRHSAFADQFREDVSHSVEAPQKLGGHIAGPDCVILEGVDGKQVIYAWTENRLERTEIRKDGSTKRPIPIGEDLKVQFSREEKGLITLRFFDLHSGTPLKAPVEFSAALGGDVK